MGHPAGHPGPVLARARRRDLQRQAHHRALYFYEMNRNKRGVCIDLAKPDGREAFLELVKTVDVVLENNSARVMPNLGLGYEDLKAVKPDDHHGVDVRATAATARTATGSPTAPTSRRRAR